MREPAILFEFGFRFLFAILFVPACFGMVDLAMEAAGLAYLADTNMTTLFANPLAWVFLLVAALVLALGALFEMCALVVVMQAGKTVGASECSKRAGSHSLPPGASARPSNWLLALFVLLLVPLTNLTVTSSALTGVRLPEFIMDFIWENGALTAVFVIVMAALYLHAFFLAFGIHFFTLCDESWMQARISSRSLLRGNAWRLARRLLALFAVFASGAVAAIVRRRPHLGRHPRRRPAVRSLLRAHARDVRIHYRGRLRVRAAELCRPQRHVLRILAGAGHRRPLPHRRALAYVQDEARARSGRLLSRHARTRFVAVLRPFARGIRIRKPARSPRRISRSPRIGAARARLPRTPWLHSRTLSTKARIGWSLTCSRRPTACSW